MRLPAMKIAGSIFMAWRELFQVTTDHLIQFNNLKRLF